MTIAGIDLGTTNSLIATWTDEGPRLIANALGDTLTPSAVSIADDGAVLVGRPAVDRLVTHPDRFDRLVQALDGIGSRRASGREVLPRGGIVGAGAALAEGGCREPGRRRHRRHR